jgi:hypothetical protein
MMDWADKLVAKKLKRGNNSVVAARLREEVKKQCDSNIKRWRGETWNTEIERTKQHKKEMRRLIGLKRQEDDMEELQYQYAQQGVDIYPDYSQCGKIASVRIPFTSEEWADVLNKEGEHLGTDISLSADISRIRNILHDACQNDHYIEVEELYEATYLAEHHGFVKDESPIGRMMSLWDKIEKDVRTRNQSASADTENPAHALEILYRCAGVICWDDAYSREGETKDVAFDRHMNRNYGLATIAAAVRTLFFKLKDLNPGPIEGYGLVREDGEIGHSHRGLAIFRTKEMAKKVCDRWNKDEAEERKGKKQVVHVFKVKKVKVCMEHGVQILPDDHKIVVTKDVEDTPEHPKPIEI